jgi:hypothetical protein
MPSFKAIASPATKPHKESFGLDAFSSRHDVPARCKNMEDRIVWLQSQLIGKSAEFETPFGKRRLTYADQTASGRCLKYIENYIIREVLPFYGMN